MPKGIPYLTEEERKEARKETKKRSQAKYRQSHKQQLKVSSAAYFETHKEQIRLQQTIHRRSKPPELTEQKRAYLKAYWQTPMGKAVQKVGQQKHRAKYLNVEGSYTTEEWLALLEFYDYCCLRCNRHQSELEKPLQADHVIPISKGGTNWISNIQPLCVDCNGMGGKGTKSTDYRCL